jgi:hypothetical protein
VKLLRQLFAILILGGGLFAVASIPAGCTKSSLGSLSSQCEQACTNYAAKCGGIGSSSFSSSASGMHDCVQSCDRGLGSKSGSSSAAYVDLLTCVANAKSCLEIQNTCSP